MIDANPPGGRLRLSILGRIVLTNCNSAGCLSASSGRVQFTSLQFRGYPKTAIGENGASVQGRTEIRQNERARSLSPGPILQELRSGECELCGRYRQYFGW
jgi:hypothetical protein